jgi:Bardet-Biedl syndrome 9 protein
MSVFQLHEWWSTKVGDEEEFDQYSFSVGNVDNSSPPSNKIIVGSLQGFLRIYHPLNPNYRIEDLVLEENLNVPILQLAVGRFIPASDTLALAVLHPRSLVVYEVLPQAVKDDRVSYYSLRKLYLHDLGLDGKHFTAFNMSYGPFGGVRGKDMLIVQSLDGKLQIFEQSAHAFSRQLVDCLIPGPIVYLPKLDAFITVNFAGVAECYRYQVLASSQGEIGEKQDSKDSKNESRASSRYRSVRSTVVEWSTNLGESCRQVVVGNFSSIDSLNTDTVNSKHSSQHGNELLFVCDKSLFLLRADTGGVIQQRRLDRSDASCVCIVPYVAELPNSNTSVSHNFLLAYQDMTVHVYSGFQLMWVAKLSSVPVHLTTGAFAGQKGLIVSIDDSGYLSVNFLGTKPAVNTILSQVRDLDYDKIDEEHRSLLQIIRDSQNDTKAEQIDKILLKSQINKSFDFDNSKLGDDPGVPSDSVPFNSFSGNAVHHSRNYDGPVKVLARFYLTYTNEKAASNVSFVVNCPKHVYATPKNIFLPKVTGLRTTPMVVKVQLYALRSQLPSSLNFSVTASYSTHKNEPQIANHSLLLPLFLVCRPKPPSKNALFKLTLDTEHPAIPLTELFSDLLFAYQEAGIDTVELLGNNAMQAMGFQHFNSSITNLSAAVSSSSNQLNPSLVSILVSKNAGRYRVQSDSFPLMFFILSELEKRLSARYKTSGTGDAATTFDVSSISPVKFTESLPLEEFFILVNYHLGARIHLLSLVQKLVDISQQYRFIEKRLLTRFKDRNPTPLNGLDSLLRETYEKIIVLADEVDSVQKKIRHYFNEIECFSKLLVNLVGLKYGLSYQERNVFQSYISPEVCDGAEQVSFVFPLSLMCLICFRVGRKLSLRVFTICSKPVRDRLRKEKRTRPPVFQSSRLVCVSCPVCSHFISCVFQMPKNVDTLRKYFLQLVERLEKGVKVFASPSLTNNVSQKN